MGFFLSATATRRSMEHTQPPIQGVPGAISPGMKRSRREADQSLPFNAEVKNAWSYTSTFPYIFMAWCLFKA
jgi:hypothetical protein